MALYLGATKICPIINEGTNPTGTISITTNGTYDVTDYASANVNVSGGGGSDPIGILFKGEVDANGVYTPPNSLTYTGNFSFNGIKSITTAGSFASYFYHQQNSSGTQRLRCKLISGTISFPDLETVNAQNCFYSFCNGQTGITSVSFPKLTSSSGSNCWNYAFQGCTGLTDIYFNAVTSTNASSFKSSLGSNMLSGVTNCKVHFPSNLSATIGSATFGGSGNTGTVFDLPATS